MSHRFRTRVWRELPFSARRAILGTLRTVDSVELWLHNTWRRLHESPEWLFVGAVGAVGVALTVLLFLSLTNELLAGGVKRVAQPIVESPIASAANVDLLDTRLCLQQQPLPQKYDTEFAFEDDRAWAQAPRRRTSSPREPERELTFDDPPPIRSAPRETPQPEPQLDWANLDPPPVGRPQLEPQIEFLKQQPRRASLPSRVQTVSARSQEPEQFDIAIRPRRRDGWTLPQERAVAVASHPERYAGETDEFSGGIIGVHATEDAAFDDPGAWAPRAEVALQVELHGPERVTAGQPAQSALVIRNTGSDTIRRVQVVEPLQPLDVVTAAWPGGPVQQDLLQREVQRLRTGREKTLSLAWFPISPGERQYQAQVLAEAFVAASVEVEPAVTQPEPQPEPQPVEEPRPIRSRTRVQPAPTELPVIEPAEPQSEPVPAPRRRPAVSCTVRGSRTIASGAVGEWIVDVRNSGETILHDVVVYATVPEGLQHRYGRDLQAAVGRLSPGASQQIVLRVVGAAPGAARIALAVKAGEPVTANAEAVVMVTPSMAVSPVAPRSKASTPAAPRTSSRAVRIDPCCGCGPQTLWIGAAF